MNARRIAVLTSGGDCPGLNACIRAVVRTALAHRLEVFGIRRGYDGLIKGNFTRLDHRAVSGIINRGGTFLLTTRSEAFRTSRGIRQACSSLQKFRIDGLVVLGGNGSLKGAWELAEKTKTAVIGIPKSVDNDVGGTDSSIGFDTAVNTAVEVIDKIRDTATSHERLFLVETMGRKRGFLALAAALAGGAEGLLIPEVRADVGALLAKLRKGKNRGKVSSIVVIAEGEDSGGAFKIARKIRRIGNYDVRVSVIGYQQRGGAPSAYDRILAAQFGSAAVEALLRGETQKLVGIRQGKLVLIPLDHAWRITKPIDPDLLHLAELLGR